MVEIFTIEDALLKKLCDCNFSVSNSPDAETIKNFPKQMITDPCGLGSKSTRDGHVKKHHYIKRRLFTSGLAKRWSVIFLPQNPLENF